MKRTSCSKAKAVEMFPGVIRKTLAYNQDTMLCHFLLKPGATIPLHHHKPTQIGYVVRGRAKFLAANDADSFIVEAGDAYVFDPDVHHGAHALEETELVEVFHPSRSEYQDF